MTNRVRLAIVDDDPDYSAYLRAMLSTRGYDVTAYSTGRAFIDGLDRTPPDVVLLDVQMPGMDGLSTLRATRRAAPDLPVIMLSGQQVPATIVDAVRAGAVDYVVKSDALDASDESALGTVIRSALEQRPATMSGRSSEDQSGFHWGESPSMQAVEMMVERVADSDVPVLITGESGVGKEVVARELHRRSPRHAKTFVKVNCAALPSELLESELFGHERGAFTGAHAVRIGKFEFAHEGTLMLDEIGEMPQGLQAKLLHVLQDNTFTKLGSNRVLSVDVRIVAATNRSMVELVQSGRFREDLYYRLQVIEMHVPPLRERPSEILPLVDYFADKYAARYDRRMPRPSAAMRDALLTYRWPGNIRELENVVKRYVILQDADLVIGELQAADRGRPLSPGAPGRRPSPPETPALPREPGNGHGEPDLTISLPTLAREASLVAERVAIQQALSVFRWNRRKAARQLGVSYKTLLNKMKECGITNVQDTAPDEP
jgi:two-component system response regulator AtoC